jgi:hypothetical protein
MKFLHLTFHFEFADAIERILEKNAIRNFVRHAMVAGKDIDGRHDGTKVFPGHVTVVQARVPEEKLDAVLEDLETFKKDKKAHGHLEAMIIPVERYV